MKRKLAKIYTPPDQPGFLGAGHIARAVVQLPFPESDPFIILMDDMLDKQDDIPVGGPHPHAGVEIGSLYLEGELGEPEHHLKKGDFEIMMAGSGVVHTETIAEKTKLRLLQMWMSPPKKDRHALPRLQRLPAAHVPVIADEGVNIRLYSGALKGAASPVHTYTPLIVAEITLQAGATTTLDIPASFNTFLYVINGSIKAGEDQQPLNQDQVGWLDLFKDDSQSELTITAGDAGARMVLYAGKPTASEVVLHGPFVADTAEDINRLYAEYRRGKMQHILSVPEAQRITW
ncbi:pirin-like C-terminal cupin domain-containing protein [uncultured Chitinophaga sp.]|jgi:Pirin-related protein|uniref:pirin family protein n=1 Tax=uncultured Chitinophaga sp. TaxID=339340 RepID=UPI002614B69E|nr:pirin-like C-terminal cupin domain-containing protein [uncultured Chitinophaga sp.]